MNRYAPAFVVARCPWSASDRPEPGGGRGQGEGEEDKDTSKKPAKSYTENDLRSGGTVRTTSRPARPPPSRRRVRARGRRTATTASPAPETALGRAAGGEPEGVAANRGAHPAARSRASTASINSFQARLNDNTVPMYGPGRDSVVENLERAKADLVRAQVGPRCRGRRGPHERLSLSLRRVRAAGSFARPSTSSRSISAATPWPRGERWPSPSSMRSGKAQPAAR